MSFKEVIQGLVEIDVNIPREGFASFLSVWLVRDEARRQTILVETGPASSIQPLVEDLKRLGVDKIDYLLFTHIHLDHSGGAGQFHAKFPETNVIAPWGAEAHLVAPDRLYQASVVALGSSLVESYGEPIPLPSRVFAGNAVNGVTFINTPGHAPFHGSYLYVLDGKRLLFPGEAAGFFQKLSDGSVYQRPATPHRFFYNMALGSLDNLLALGDVDMICYPHFGSAGGEDARSALKQARSQMKLWKDVVSAHTPDTSEEKLFDALCVKDALLRNIEKLDKRVSARERFFISQSIRGFKGFIFNDRS